MDFLNIYVKLKIKLYDAGEQYVAWMYAFKKNLLKSLDFHSYDT